MHVTAYRIGSLVLSEYCALDDADILEIGAFNVNGLYAIMLIPLPINWGWIS
jgi:hypothetical protein